MMFSKPAALLLGSVAALSLAACSQPEQTSPTAPISTAPFAWPATLRVVGDGYPAAGAPCRRIGETAATVDYLDDSADLVGCPASDQAAIAAQQRVPALQGRQHSYFCGAWCGYGFHEDGLKSGFDAAQALLSDVDAQPAHRALAA